MKATLPSGRAVQLGVHHLKNEKIVDRTEYTGTLVRLTLEGGKEFTGNSILKPPDVFCKRMGRRCAANSLLRRIKVELTSKMDRKFIFDKICPEYTKKKTAPAKPEAVAKATEPTKAPEAVAST